MGINADYWPKRYRYENRHSYVDLGADQENRIHFWRKCPGREL